MKSVQIIFEVFFKIEDFLFLLTAVFYHHFSFFFLLYVYLNLFLKQSCCI